MKDVRCKNCNKLLAKADNKGHIEIKCPRCKTLNESLGASNQKGDRPYDQKPTKRMDGR